VKATLVILALSLAAVSAAAASERPVNRAKLRFDFRPGKVERGFTRVTAEDLYSNSKGYGFDLGSKAERSFFFSVGVSEGNYRVTATFGDRDKATLTTVKAESRRLMVERVETRKGSFEKRVFTVNVRNSRIAPGDGVRLKEREIGALHWDDKLTLEFGNDRPALVSLEIEKVEDAITVFLAGDSTVTDQQVEPWAAWGQMLPRFFDAKVAIANHAESGEPLKAFASERRVAKMTSQMKPGDFLFIQFTHNDQKPGPNFVEPFTTYKEQLRLLMNEARARGVTPVLVTSMLRRNFGADGRIVNTLGDYPEAMRQIARDEKVALIDLNAASRTFYETLGPEGSKGAFVHYKAGTFPGQNEDLKDDTHFNPYGAYELARAVVEGIRRDVPRLGKHLVRGIPSFDPAHPDPISTWRLPATAGRVTEPPAGR
jgi:lysophospholipase L1-like esterase